jgi:hypothetical protein
MAMPDRHADLRRTLEETVLKGPGHTDPALRQACADGRSVPEELRTLVDTIERNPAGVTDRDIETLKARYSEDELFEIVVSAALGASMRRIRAALAAVEAS